MKKVNKILIASNNPAKIKRYKRMLSNYFSSVINLKQFNIANKPKETGENAEENAEIKGKYYAKKTGLTVFSEDEALYVDFLPKSRQPGVHVRRIDGKDEVDDKTLLKHWEEILSRVPQNQRTGKWHIAYSITPPNGESKTISIDHLILFFYPPSKRLIPGWPMSSLEGPLSLNKPHSELTKRERKLHENKTDRHVLIQLKELFKQ